MRILFHLKSFFSLIPFSIQPVTFLYTISPMYNIYEYIILLLFFLSLFDFHISFSYHLFFILFFCSFYLYVHIRYLRYFSNLFVNFISFQFIMYLLRFGHSIVFIPVCSKSSVKFRKVCEQFRNCFY